MQIRKLSLRKLPGLQNKRNSKRISQLYMARSKKNIKMTSSKTRPFKRMGPIALMNAFLRGILQIYVTVKYKKNCVAVKYKILPQTCKFAWPSNMKFRPQKMKFEFWNINWRTPIHRNEQYTRCIFSDRNSGTHNVKQIKREIRPLKSFIRIIRRHELLNAFL